MSENNSLTESFDAFINNIAGTTDDKLFLTAGVVELLRHSKSAQTGLAIAELLVGISAPVVEWNRIPFSITKTILSEKFKRQVIALGVPAEMVADVLLAGLLAFIADIQTKTLTEDLLQKVIREIAEEFAAASREEPPAAPKIQPPEIFNHWLVKRVFDPEDITDDVLTKIDAKLVYFAAPIGQGSLGPEIRGLAFDNGTNHYFVLLEDGEFVRVPKDYEHLKIVNKDVLFPDIPTALFLSLCVAAQELETYAVISKPQTAFISAGNLGKPLVPLVPAVASVKDLAALERMFDMSRESAMLGHTGATGPVGAVVRFPIPETDLIVVLDANQDSFGPYCTARLVRVNDTGTETVLMRHETPRLYSSRGVYLFPLQDQLISLTIMF